MGWGGGGEVCLTTQAFFYAEINEIMMAGFIMKAGYHDKGKIVLKSVCLEICFSFGFISQQVLVYSNNRDKPVSCSFPLKNLAPVGRIVPDYNILLHSFFYEIRVCSILFKSL